MYSMIFGILVASLHVLKQIFEKFVMKAVILHLVNSRTA